MFVGVPDVFVREAASAFEERKGGARLICNLQALGGTGSRSRRRRARGIVVLHAAFPRCRKRGDGRAHAFARIFFSGLDHPVCFLPVGREGDDCC